MDRGIRTLLVTALLACAPSPTGSLPSTAEVIRVGLLGPSDRDPETCCQLLGEFLARETGYEIELTHAENRRELVAAFENRDVSVVWIGGYDFARLSAAGIALPIAMRNADLASTTDFIVRAQAEGASLQEYSGRRIAFGPRLSTAGHLMAWFYLARRGMEPEAYFSEIRHAEDDETTARWVREGQVDIGVISSLGLESMLQDGRLRPNEVRVVRTTPPFRNFVWAVRRELGFELRISLLNAFLSLDATIPEHRQILAAVDADFFLPVSAEEFKEIEEAGRVLLDSGEPVAP